MDRELLIEIGCEEIPASWLPGLTTQLGQQLEGRLRDVRVVPEAPIETFSTPRRLTARVAKVAERQTDLEELVTGPPVSAAVGKDGAPSPAALGFAKKYGVEVKALEKIETPKGAYLGYRVHQRGRATADVLADVMTGILRGLTFPKQMRWDAFLEDGKGALVFARPFVIRRTELAQGPTVQDVRSGSSTYGHRFLTTSGRAGRAIKIKTFDDYQARLLENFVILDRAERESRIRRELETHARKLGARLSGLGAHSSLLAEVPDLVEYPAVVAGHFPPEFLQLPEEVLTTTMIHHQHYFPVVGEDGALKPAFLAVTNMQPERPEVIGRNAERVLTARLRDARFFWDADRQVTLESRVERLATVLFHKKLGSYREKADRIASLASWIVSEALGRPDLVADTDRAGRLCKADLATDMVRELTELQGTMGGIYAREEGLPESVWKAIYYHYLPVGVEVDAAPSRAQLGAGSVVWAAVSLADRFDSVVGMYAAGERPTGSRDPLGLRRHAQGAVKILADLPELTGLGRRVTIGSLVERAGVPFSGHAEAGPAVHAFVSDRLAYLLEQRGFDVRSIRAVMHGEAAQLSPLEVRRKLEVLAQMSGSPALRNVAALFKRVKNISKGVDAPADLARVSGALAEPAEVALRDAVLAQAPAVRAALAGGDYRQAFVAVAALGPVVATFFDDVMVMAEDQQLRTARLQLVAALRDVILGIADLSEMVTEAS
jgi:glycyl-tRNA synthetase beta chain